MTAAVPPERQWPPRRRSAPPWRNDREQTMRKAVRLRTKTLGKPCEIPRQNHRRHRLCFRAVPWRPKRLSPRMIRQSGNSGRTLAITSSTPSSTESMVKVEKGRPDEDASAWPGLIELPEGSLRDSSHSSGRSKWRPAPAESGHVCPPSAGETGRPTLLLAQEHWRSTRQ